MGSLKRESIFLAKSIYYIIIIEKTNYMDLDLNIEERITEQDILACTSEESIFCHYMGIPFISKGLYRSIVREDKKPTCSFWRGKKLYLKDFATGDCLDCFSLVMRLYDCDYANALKHIANDLGIKAYKLNHNRAALASVRKFVKTTGPTIIQVETKNFTDKELKWWAQFGITLDILRKFNVYSCKHVFLNGSLNSISSPRNMIFTYYFGKKDKIEKHKVYFPMRKTFRFLNNLDSKTLQGWKQLPQEGKVLFITKSQKDIMCLYSLGLPAIAPNSEHLFLTPETLDKLKHRFKHIIVLYDNDRTGLQEMIKIKKEFPELNYTFIPRTTGSKDISDYYKDHGKAKTFELIKKYLIWLAKKNEKTLE